MSQHETTSEAITDFKTALFGRGEAPWQPYSRKEGDDEVAYMRIVLEGEGEQLAEYYRGMSDLKDFPGCDKTILGMGNGQVNILVPLDAFEKQVRPFITKQLGAEPIHGGREILNDPQSVMRNRVHALLFEKGWMAWDAHPSELTGNEYCRAFSADDLRVGDEQYRLSDVATVARDLLQKELGITKMRSFANEKLGQCYFAIEAQDYKNLKKVLEPKSGGPMENNLRHLVLGKTYAMKLDEQRKQEAATARGA